MKRGREKGEKCKKGRNGKKRKGEQKEQKKFQNMEDLGQRGYDRGQKTLCGEMEKYISFRKGGRE
jgi:hypothetical protein